MRIKYDLLHCLLFSFLVLFILLIFQPFGIDTVYPSNAKYPLVLGYSVIAFLAIMAPKFLFKDYFSDKSLYLEIFAFFSTTVIVGDLLGYLFYQGYFDVPFTWPLFFEFFLFCGSTALIPFIYFTLSVINKRDRENLSPVKKGKIFVLEGNNRKEKISFQEKELLYIKSSKNYVEVFLLQGKEIKKELLRNTFGNILDQLDNPSIKRVHRSYAVNLANDFLFKKNELVFEELDLRVPVSETYAKVLDNNLLASGMR